MGGLCNSRKLLTFTSSVCSCVSFAFLCVAVATDIGSALSNRVTNPNGTKETFLNTTAGLWRKCMRAGLSSDVPVPRKDCSYINYFDPPEDEDDMSATETILQSTRRSAIFPLISLFILLVANIICYLGHCNHRRQVLTFISGILFVMGGLCTLIGIILYIGAITEEVGNYKPKSGLEDPKFTYSYGLSFALIVGSFVMSEATGVLSVYLYISRNRHAYKKKQERVGMTANEQRTQRFRRNKGETSTTSPSHSESYYTYTPVSDNAPSTMNRDASRHTISTTADVTSGHHMVDTLRRTTPV